MASHRRPRNGVLKSPAARRGAVTLTTAALASVSLLPQSARAEPTDRPSLEEVREQVDELYRQAGTATQKYNAAKERTDTQREQVNVLLDQVAQRTDALNDARRTLGTFAAAQYREGGVSETATWLLTEDAQAFFHQKHVMERMAERQQQAVVDYQRAQRKAAEQRTEASRSLTSLTHAQTELRTSKQAVQAKLGEARALLAKLTAEEKRRLEALERQRQAEARKRAAARAKAEAERAKAEAERAAAEAENADPGGGSPNSGSSSAAQQAIDFAKAQLGKPYVWGATGPNSFDCSGLTQAAWARAGVSLPRTTWDQVNAGTTVAKADMRPGDLVFFYEDISHVGLYLGDGEMIHAPKPGESVRVEAVDYMPFHSAVRPG